MENTLNCLYLIPLSVWGSERFLIREVAHRIYVYRRKTASSWLLAFLSCGFNYAMDTNMKTLFLQSFWWYSLELYHHASPMSAEMEKGSRVSEKWGRQTIESTDALSQSIPASCSQIQKAVDESPNQGLVKPDRPDWVHGCRVEEQFQADLCFFCKAVWAGVGLHVPWHEAYVCEPILLNMCRESRPSPYEMGS